MHTVGYDIDQVYLQLVRDLVSVGTKTTCRGLTTLELTNYQFEIINPRASILINNQRNLDMRYCMGEICFYLKGSTSLLDISNYSKFWLRLSDDGFTINSAYGFRLFKQRNKHDKSQLLYVINTLFDDAYSRKAVMPIYSHDDAYESKDNPCTMHMQFLIRNNCLDCYTFMRSNDIWLGTPYDVAFFTLVQEIVFVALREKYPTLKLGSYYHHAMSLHVYDAHIKDLLTIYESVGSQLTNVALSIERPPLILDDVQEWFADLLNYENAQLHALTYIPGNNSLTPLQTWCKSFLR